MKSETRTAALSLRLTPTVKAALDRAAFNNQRSVASLSSLVIVEWLIEKGYLPKSILDAPTKPEGEGD